MLFDSAEGGKAFFKLAAATLSLGTTRPHKYQCCYAEHGSLRRPQYVSKSTMAIPGSNKILGRDQILQILYALHQDHHPVDKMNALYPA